MQFHNDGCLPLSLLCRVPLLVAVLPLLCTACLAMTLSYLSTRPSWFCTLPPTTNALIFLYLQTCQCCVLPTALFVALAHPALLPLQVQLDLKRMDKVFIDVHGASPPAIRLGLGSIRS